MTSKAILHSYVTWAEGKILGCLELLGNHLLHGSTVLGETSDTLGQLGVGHGVLGKVEQEGGLVVDVGNLGQSLGSLSVLDGKLLLDGTLGVLELLEQLGRDGQKVATGKFEDLANVAERSTHYNGLVAVLTVVSVDLLDREHTGVLVRGVLLALGLLVVVEDTADKGRDEGDVGLGTGDSLVETKEERQVAVDVVLRLELTGGLDAFPGGGNLDEDTLALDTERLVEGDEVLGLLDGGLLVVRQTGVDLGRDTAGDDLENLDTESDEEAVGGKVELLRLVRGLLLGVLDGDVN